MYLTEKLNELEKNLTGIGDHISVEKGQGSFLYFSNK